MRRLIISLLIMLVLAFAMAGCYATRKSDRRLTSLMLQDNKKLGRNKEYYSRHNRKTKRDAYRKYSKNRR